MQPDNVLIGADGHCKLADFGLSAMGLINKQAREPGGEPSTDVKVSRASGVKVEPRKGRPTALTTPPHRERPTIWLRACCWACPTPRPWTGGPWESSCSSVSTAILRSTGKLSKKCFRFCFLFFFLSEPNYFCFAPSLNETF